MLRLNIITILSLLAVSCSDAGDFISDADTSIEIRADDLSCVRLVFVDPNPQDDIGTPVEWRRSLAVDGTSCAEDHFVHIMIHPYVGEFLVEEIQTKMAITSGACSSLGGPESGAGQPTFLGSTGNLWTSFDLTMEIDGEVSYTYAFPLDLVAVDYVLLGDPPMLDSRVLEYYGGGWHLGAVDTPPHC